MTSFAKPLKDFFMRKGLLFSLLLVFLLAGCSSSPTEEFDETKDWSAEMLYEHARIYMDKADYQMAIEYLQKIESRYPFGTYALQAQLDSAYAYYKNEDFDLSVATAERFIKMNPLHPSVDYAYYLKGLANSDRLDSFMTRLFSLDTTKRCQDALKEAFNDFRTIVTKYPDSRYAAEAHKRMVNIRDDLAKQEINVARFYYERGALIATINRSKYVIAKYQETPSLYDALILMAKAYKDLGMEALYEDTVRILRHNYPSDDNITQLFGA